MSWRLTRKMQPRKDFDGAPATYSGNTAPVVRNGSRGAWFQWLAVLLCTIFGIAIIVNVQLGGDAMWFWYATLFQRGVKLYADLHFALQPFYVLETSTWMRLVGVRCIPYESLGLVHVIVFCLGMLLVLRESAWPDWQKAIVLLGSFVISIQFDAYRFDDFHIVSDCLYVYSMALLLILARTESTRRQVVLVVTLGILSGLVITNRVTDGGLLMMAVALGVFFLTRTGKLAALSAFLLSTALSWLAVVRLTGDSLQNYVSNSIFKAASAKGGTGSVLRGPAAALFNNIERLRHRGKRELLFMACIVLLGVLVKRYWKRDNRYIAAVEVVVMLALAYATHGWIRNLMRGSLIGILSMVVQLFACLLVVVVAWRAIRSFRVRDRPQAWDAREIVVLIPAASLMSAALSQATGTSNSTSTMALLCLLVPVLIAARSEASWRTASFVAFAGLAAIAGITYKVERPYSWGAADNKPMFVGRQWYRHPLYGPMYIDSDLLNFTRPLCIELDADRVPDGTTAGLLSIPFPYTNYFCGIPPWKNYVQTWYDTVTPATVATLIGQLETAPPEWILYQRQTEVIHAHEIEYNHGQPIMHRQLDELLLQKIGSGQWQLVGKKHYLEGDGWLLIHTTPPPS